MTPLDSVRSFINTPHSENPHAAQRERYSSFSAYAQERIQQKGPIDLIAGRGTSIEYNPPKLKTSRLKNGDEVSYSPFTIDINPQVNPDLLSDVLNIHYTLPSCSVDEIYLERIYPPIYLDLRIYQMAIKILKIGGELIIDYNDGKWDESLRKEQALIIKNALLTLKIPFELTFITGNGHECQRNNEHDFSALKCVKVANFDSEERADLFQRAESMLNTWNYDIEQENKQINKTILSSMASYLSEKKK